MSDFDGSVVVVTGGASGIGAATVRRFAALGARVAIVDVNAQAARELATELEAAGATVGVHQLDVADRAKCLTAVDDIVRRLGEIRVPVSCAGIAARQTLASMTGDDWDRTIAINLSGAFNMLKATRSSLAKTAPSSIVNVASLAGTRVSYHSSANYTASKAGLLGLTRHAALELAADGIRVNAVSPGPVLTPMVTQFTTAEERNATADRVPLGDWVMPENVAAAILFLASSEASMITGIDLPVDGGALLSSGAPRSEYFKVRS